MPNDSQNMFNHPMVTLALLMMASVPDPQGKLNNLGNAITSMRDAIVSINSGLDAFHTQVVPMFMVKPEQKKK